VEEHDSYRRKQSDQKRCKTVKKKVVRINFKNSWRGYVSFSCSSVSLEDAFVEDHFHEQLTLTARHPHAHLPALVNGFKEQLHAA
jgi:hypothetical protein